MGRGATDVPLTRLLTLVFSEPVVLNDGLIVSVAGTAVEDGDRVVFTADGGWPSDATIDVDVRKSRPGD